MKIDFQKYEAVSDLLKKQKKGELELKVAERSYTQRLRESEFLEKNKDQRVPLTLSDGTNLGDVTYETMKALSNGKNNVKARTPWEEETLGKYRQRQENAFAARNITGPLQYPSSDEIRKEAYEHGVVAKSPGPSERKAIGGVALGLGPRDMDSYNRMLSLSQTPRQRQEEKKKDAQVLLGAAMQKQLNEERKIQGYADGKTKEEIQQDYARAKAQQGGLSSKYWREEDAEAYRQEYEALDEEISLYRDAMRYKLAQEEREKRGAAAAPVAQDSGAQSGQENGEQAERASFGQWLGAQLNAGLSSFNKGITSTLDFILPTEFLGKYDFISKLNDYYGGLNESYSEQAQKVSSSRGKGWKTSGDILSATVAAVPNAILAFLSGGASIGAQAGVGLAGSAGGAASGASGTLSSLGSSIQTMMRNPLYWTSVMQTLGTDYEEAKERGASDLAASASAILTTALNAGIEIGGGIETLPQGLRAGGKTAVEQWVRSMIDEGKEEVLQGITSNAMAKLLYDKDAPLVSLSDETAVINPVQSAAEFGAGAAVGGILGGGQVALNTGVNAGRMREMGKTLNDPDIVNAMIDTGIEYRSKDSQAYQFAQEARKKNGKLSNYEIGRLYNATGKFLNDPEIVDMMIETGLESPQDSRAYKLAKEASKKKGNLTEYEIGRLYRANVEQIRLEENRSVAQYEEEGQGSAAASEAEAARQTQNMTAPQVQRIPEGAVNPQGEELQSSAAWGEAAQMEERAPQAQRVPEGTVDPQAQGAERSRSYGYDGRYGEATIDTPQAQAAVDFMDFAAARYGARFALYSDPDSKENGYYSGGVCHVNTAGDEPLYYTATHEFLHFFEDADPQGYQNLMGSVRNNMIRGKVWQQAMEKTMEDIRRRGENPQDYTQAQIFDITLKEKVSEIGTEVLKNPETFEKIAKEDSNFAQRIMEFIRGVISRLRESVSTYFSRDVGQVRSAVHNYEQLEKIYQKVLATSSARGELTERGTYRVRPAGETGAMYSMENRGGMREQLDALYGPTEQTEEGESVPQARAEDFSGQIDRWMRGEMGYDDVFRLGDTPQVLQRFGAKNYPLVMNQDTMIKVTGLKHEIALDDIREIPQKLQDPLLLFQSKKDKNAKAGTAFVAFVDMVDKAGDPVLVAVHLNEYQKRMKVNRIASIYGKERVENFLRNQTADGNLLYANKKSQEWFTIRGLQLPKMVQTNQLDSTNSIPQSEDNVNTGDGELTERGTYRVKPTQGSGGGESYVELRNEMDAQQGKAPFYSMGNDIQNNRFGDSETIDPVLNNPKIERYSDAELENWKKSKSIVPYENERQFYKFVENARNNVDVHKKIYFGKLSDSISKQIFDRFGIDLSGYNIALKGYEIRKILLNSHGNSTRESLRGQEAITEKDLLNIPTIITEADDVVLSDRLYEGKPTLIFSKTIEGKNYVVAYTSTKHHDLAIQTMYKGKKRSLSPATNANALVSTSETTSGTTSNFSIPQNGGNVNTGDGELTERGTYRVKSADEAGEQTRYSMRRGVDDTQGVTAMRGADRESEYTWESLTQKPDMEITRLSQQLPYTEDGTLDRAAVKKKAIENVRAMGNPKNTKNAQYVYCADVKQDILVSAKALSHGLNRKPGATALVEMNIGPVLANAIKVNELTPRENVQSAYELIGMAEDSQGNQYPTRIVVNQYKNGLAQAEEIELLDVIYAIKAKKVEAVANTQTDSENPKLPLSPKLQEQRSLQSPTSSTSISIADLLSIVKDYFPDGLSQSVLDQFGMQRPKGSLSDSAIYSMRRPNLDEMLSRAQVDMEAYEKADGELSQSFYRSWRNALYVKQRYLKSQRYNVDLVLEQPLMDEERQGQLKSLRETLTREIEEIERQTEIADKYEFLLNEDKVSHPERYIGKAAQQVKATPDGTDKTSRGRVKRLKTKAERKRLEIAGKIQDLEYALSTMDEGDPLHAQTVKNLERLRAQQAVNLKESEVAKIAEETLKQIDSIGTPNFEGMDSVVLDASDVGIYRFKSIYRNMQKIFGDDYALVYDQLLGPFDKSKGDAAKEARELLSEEYDYIVKKLGIKKGSREEKAVQWFGEGERNPDIKKESDRKALRAMGIQNIKNLDPNIRIPYTRDMLIQEFGEEEARKIRDAARWYRNVYDELFDQINEVRRRIYPNNPEKIMHKRKDYFRHFREMSEGLQGIANIFGTDANIDPKLAGISEYTRPKEKWASIKQERKGNATDEGAIEGFHDFLPQAMQAIYIDEHIDNFRAFAKLMADVKSQDDGNGDLNGFILYLNDFAEMLAGKTAPIDRALMKVFGNNDTGRKVLKALTWLDNRAKGNMIGGNISTILAQPSNMIGALAQIENPADSAKGFSDAWKDLCGDSAMRERSEESNFLSERYLEKAYDRFEKNGIIKGAGKLLGFSDEIGTRVSWHAYYNEGVRKGVNPVEYADNMTRQAVAGRGIGEVPLGFQSKLGRFFFPFMIEVQNNWHVIGDILRKKQYSTPGKNGLNNAGRILAYFLMVYLFNSMTELMRGSKVAFDPIGDVAEGVEQGLKEGRTGGEKAKQAALRSVQNLAGDAISNSPFGTIGQIASGLSEETISNFTNDSLYPARGAVPGLGTAATAVGKFFGDESSRNPLGGAVDLITTYVTPFGGNQINKTIRGVSDYVHGGKYKNDIYKELQSGERGDKRYEIEKNIPNLLRSAAFGPSSLPESREYNEQYRLSQYEKEREKKEAQERMDDFIKEYKENPDSRVMEVYKETKRKEVFPYEEAPAVITVTSYDREFEVPFDRAAFQEDLLKRIQEKYEEVFRRLDYGKLSGEEKVAFFDKAKKEAMSDVKKAVTDGFKETDAAYKQWTKSEKAKRRSK